RQRHDLYAKYHDYDSEISDLLGECGSKPFQVKNKERKNTVSKKPEQAMQLVGVASSELSEILDYFFSQIPASERAAIERLSERLAKAAVFVAMKAHLDPAAILHRELAALHVTDQAMDGPGEAAPRIPHAIHPMSEDEINQLAAPLREAVRQLALSGVPGVQAAGVLMTFAAQILMQESGGDFRATSLAMSAFAGAVDKGRSIRPS
ncbi:hypothetical protein G5V65_21590, partial [Rhodobacter sp. HX-7-19]